MLLFNKPTKYDKLYNFTEPELRYLRRECNFTPEELKYFNLKAKSYSNTAVAMEMYILESKVSVLARKVKHKILKVI